MQIDAARLTLFYLVVAHALAGHNLRILLVQIDFEV